MLTFKHLGNAVADFLDLATSPGAEIVRPERTARRSAA
jgi:hypothetical protein